MKKKIKIIKILILVILTSLIILLVKFKVNADKVEQLNNEADIYISFFDGNISAQQENNGKYALITISQNKLYIVNWFNLYNGIENQKSIYSYSIKTKTISTEEINELLYLINNSADNTVVGSIQYYNVRYKGKNTMLRALPFSY